jgi:hypothetical protein
MSLSHIGWIHILVSKLCLLVSWLSPGVPHGFEIFIYFLFVPNQDCNACPLVVWKLSPSPAHEGLFFMLGVMFEATTWYWWSNFFFPTIGFESSLKGSRYRDPQGSAYGQAVGAFYFFKFSVECNVHELAACLASLQNENYTLFVIWI